MVPIVLVVEPQEEAAYRSAWPDALMLVLPRPLEGAVGCARWMVQRLCTSARDRATGRELCLPFIWMADDLMVSFYRLEQPAGSSTCRMLRALPNRGFHEALLAAQRHPEICNMAVVGFLRDRGLSHRVRQDWVMDRSLALQKIVLLNLVRLEELGVEYCQHLRKSEDLALCYDVEQRVGGHVLKAQSYCYRAVHLEEGGAEIVRQECRYNEMCTVEELVLGGDLAVLRPAHRKVAEALLKWLRTAQRNAADRNGDHDDEGEAASEVLCRQLASDRALASGMPKYSKVVLPTAVASPLPCGTDSDVGYVITDSLGDQGEQLPTLPDPSRERPLAKRQRVSGQEILGKFEVTCVICLQCHRLSNELTLLDNANFCCGDLGVQCLRDPPWKGSLSWVACGKCQRPLALPPDHMSNVSGAANFLCEDFMVQCGDSGESAEEAN